MDVGAHPRRENFEGRRKHVVHAAACAEGERKLSVRINVARRLYRALRIPGNIGNNSNERPPRTC